MESKAFFFSLLTCPGSFMFVTWFRGGDSGWMVGHRSYKLEIVWFLEPKQSKD